MLACPPPRSRLRARASQRQWTPSASAPLRAPGLAPPLAPQAGPNAPTGMQACPGTWRPAGAPCAPPRIAPPNRRTERNLQGAPPKACDAPGKLLSRSSGRPIGGPNWERGQPGSFPNRDRSHASLAPSDPAGPLGLPSLLHRCRYCPPSKSGQLQSSLGSAPPKNNLLRFSWSNWRTFFSAPARRSNPLTPAPNLINPPPPNAPQLPRELPASDTTLTSSLPARRTAPLRNSSNADSSFKDIELSPAAAFAEPLTARLKNNRSPSPITIPYQLPSDHSQPCARQAYTS